MAGTPEATADERREAWRIWGLCLALTAAGLAIAAQFVAPPPPERLVLATGGADGSYATYGQELARAMAPHGLTIEVRPTVGSVENVALLEAGEVDLAFVQGGILADQGAPSDDDTEERVVSLASVFHEPLWILHRADVALDDLRDLAGLRLGVGPEGSGTRPVALTLARANGVGADEATFDGRPLGEAAAALRAGELDVLFAVTSTRSATIRELLHDEDVVLFEVDRHLAYERAHRALRHVVLGRGQIDLVADLPPKDVDLLAPVATLVSRDSLHAALVPVLIDACRGVFGGGDAFSAPGAFPSPHHVDAPLGPYAERAHRSGLSFLYKLLPFRLAATLDRLKILLLPLLTLLLPLLKVAPPVYRWRIRSKIIRWYRQLRELERRLVTVEDEQQRAAVVAELEAVEQEIEEVVVPASYLDEFYALRMHAELVRQRVHEGAAAG